MCGDNHLIMFRAPYLTDNQIMLCTVRQSGDDAGFPKVEVLNAKEPRPPILEVLDQLFDAAHEQGLKISVGLSENIWEEAKKVNEERAQQEATESTGGLFSRF